MYSWNIPVYISVAMSNNCYSKHVIFVFKYLYSFNFSRSNGRNFPFCCWSVEVQNKFNWRFERCSVMLWAKLNDLSRMKSPKNIYLPLLYHSSYISYHWSHSKAWSLSSKNFSFAFLYLRKSLDDTYGILWMCFHARTSCFSKDKSIKGACCCLSSNTFIPEIQTEIIHNVHRKIAVVPNL